MRLCVLTGDSSLMDTIEYIVTNDLSWPYQWMTSWFVCLQLQRRAPDGDHNSCQCNQEIADVLSPFATSLVAALYL